MAMPLLAFMCRCRLASLLCLLFKILTVVGLTLQSMFDDKYSVVLVELWHQ